MCKSSSRHAKLHLPEPDVRRHGMLSSSQQHRVLLNCACYATSSQLHLHALAVFFIRRWATILAVLHMHCAFGHSTMLHLYLSQSHWPEATIRYRNLGTFLLGQPVPSSHVLRCLRPIAVYNRQKKPAVRLDSVLPY